MELKLFNVVDDLGERFDLAKKHPEKVKALEMAYNNWIDANVKK